MRIGVRYGSANRGVLARRRKASAADRARYQSTPGEGSFDGRSVRIAVRGGALEDLAHEDWAFGQELEP
jgi:hypothetical protein